MLSEKDKKNLFGGKKCICRYFAKREALKELKRLIEEADAILAAFPPVEFGNEFQTAGMYTNLLAKETQWSSRVDNVLLEMFGNKPSDVEQMFGRTIVANHLHAYAGVRSTLAEKRKILVELKNAIV